MASSQKLCGRLKNICRNEEMIAALRIHSKATQLFSTSSKRQIVEAKSNNLSPEEDKPETQTLRSLRTQGMRPEFSDPNLNIMSLAHLGPISMSDAYSGAGFGKELIERISKKPHEEFGDGNSVKGVCENGSGLELGSLSWKQEYIRRFVPGRNRGISNLRFLPCSNATMIVVRNEIGNVGFWDFNSSVNVVRNFNASTFLFKEHYGVGRGDSYIFIGNRKRGVDVISSTKKRTVFTSPSMPAILGRFDAQPYKVGMLAGATCWGHVYIWKLG